MIDDRTTAPEGGANMPEDLEYFFQDDSNNNGARIIDLCYTSFMRAKGTNSEDGGSTDWFNDTKPNIDKLIGKMRKQFAATLARPAVTPGDAAVPVAWRVTNFADGWILFHTEVEARHEAEGAGNLVQPLYAVAPTPPAPVGLVDAVRAYLAANDAVNGSSIADDDTHINAAVFSHQEAKLLVARATLDATLSGQQCGAVPAGDLP